MVKVVKYLLEIVAVALIIIGVVGLSWSFLSGISF